MTIQLKQDVLNTEDLTVEGGTGLQRVEGDTFTASTVSSKTATVNGNSNVTTMHSAGNMQTTQMGVGVAYNVAGAGKLTFPNIIDSAKVKLWISGAGFRDYMGFSVEGSRLNHQVPTGSMHKFVDGNNSMAPAASPWALIEQQGWLAPTFSGSWYNYGSGWAPAAYFKDSAGMVHLRGLVRLDSPAAGTTIFNLPAGYRPAESILWHGHSGEPHQSCRVDVQSNGNVVFSIGAVSAYVTLGMIHFLAEA